MGRSPHDQQVGISVVGRIDVRVEFFVLPMGIAFLAGVLIALAGVFVSNPKKLALVSYIAAFILGFVIYWAPDI
ncbi:MAG: hypothetical protein R3C02_20820 [Planctomycetaceae bacterium]